MHYIRKIKTTLNSLFLEKKFRFSSYYLTRKVKTNLQADHLRQQTLQQMYQILTLHQAAQALLALGEYLQRLRVLSSIWSARPRDPTNLIR